MATNFPTSLDAFTNPTAVDTLDSPPHDAQHADANDAIEALQAKVGVDGSAVTDSLDYKVANFTNKLGSGAAVRTLGSFVGGDALQAAELNAIGTWTTWTPNVRASLGTLGGVTLYYAYYSQVNDIVIGVLAYKITSIGTGSGVVVFDLPASNADYSFSNTGTGLGTGRENQLNGHTMNVVASSATTVALHYYDNANTVAAGQGGGIVFAYRTA